MSAFDVKECRSCGAEIIWTDRFWSKVDYCGDCWLWTGARVTDGYGVFWLDGRNVAAHRLSWSIANGPIPDDGQILHHCDNPPCVKPAHLYCGSHADNMRDRTVRGRSGSHGLRGEQMPLASLKDQDVLRIRARYRPRLVTQQQLADEYEVPLHVITDVIRRKTWRHL